MDRVVNEVSNGLLGLSNRGTSGLVTGDGSCQVGSSQNLLSRIILSGSGRVSFG